MTGSPDLLARRWWRSSVAFNSRPKWTCQPSGIAERRGGEGNDVPRISMSRATARLGCATSFPVSCGGEEEAALRRLGLGRLSGKPVDFLASSECRNGREVSPCVRPWVAESSRIEDCGAPGTGRRDFRATRGYRCACGRTRCAEGAPPRVGGQAGGQDKADPAAGTDERQRSLEEQLIKVDVAVALEQVETRTSRKIGQMCGGGSRCLPVSASPRSPLSISHGGLPTIASKPAVAARHWHRPGRSREIRTTSGRSARAPRPFCRLESSVRRGALDRVPRPRI